MLRTQKGKETLEALEQERPQLPHRLGLDGARETSRRNQARTQGVLSDFFLSQSTMHEGVDMFKRAVQRAR